MKNDSEKPKWKSATAINDTTANIESSKPKSFLTPSLPYFPSRRGSSPLVAELNALREAEQGSAGPLLLIIYHQDFTHWQIFAIILNASLKVYEQ